MVEMAKQKSPLEKLKEKVGDFIEGVVEELQWLVAPPRPVRVPVTAGGRRR